MVRALGDFVVATTDVRQTLHLWQAHDITPRGAMGPDQPLRAVPCTDALPATGESDVGLPMGSNLCFVFNPLGNAQDPPARSRRHAHIGTVK